MPACYHSMMTWGDRLKMWVIIVAVVVLCAYIAKPTQAQQYPAQQGDGVWLENPGHPLPAYFWDWRTNMCFAYLSSRNFYGTVISIATVPCTAEVHRIITNKPDAVK